MASAAPLPPGWEARWDPNQRAFFYINHATKQTTWSDPRIGYQPQAQQYGQQAFGGHQFQHQQAAQSLNQPTHHLSSSGQGQGQGIAMATKYKQFGSTITSTEGESDEDFESPDFEALFSSSSGNEQKVDIQKLHAIKQIYPDAPEEIIKERLKKYNNAQVKVTNDLFALGYKREAPGQHPPPRTDDMITRLKAMFPTAADDIISEVLNGANNDEKEARSNLEMLGFKKSFPQTHRASTPTARHTTSPARQPTPVKRTPSPKPTSPAKPKMSEAEKTKLERKIQGQFPSYDMSVVKMALQVCNYDESRVKAVLERMGETSLADGRKAPPSRPGTSRARSRSPSPKPLSPAALEPVSIFADDDTSSRPSTSSSHQISSSSSAGSSRPSTSSSKTSTGRISSSSSKTSTGRIPSPRKTTSHTPRQPQASHARAKKVTELSKDILSSTITTLNSLTNNVPCCGRPRPPVESTNQSSPRSPRSPTPSSQSAAAAQSHDQAAARQSHDQDSSSRQRVVSQQPQGSGAAYVSELRTEAKGPDPSLRQGPDKTLLLTEYMGARGPNPELRQGPDASRAAGPQGAMGPDRSLNCGPEHQLSKGPERLAPLVTAI